MQVRPVPPKPHFVCDVAEKPQACCAHPTERYGARGTRTRERQNRGEDIRSKRSQGSDLRISESYKLTLAWRTVGESLAPQDSTQDASDFGRDIGVTPV